MQPVLRVLLVEDNAEDAELITRELQRADGYQIIMERVENEDEFKRALHRRVWDYIVCDYALPSFSAERVIELIEGYKLDTPLVLVSGKITREQAARVLGRRAVYSFVSKDELSNLGAMFRREMQLSRRYDQMLVSWARALELRDRVTAGHTERVADLTVRIARAMGVSEIDIMHMRRGALLHDIGKIVVPDAILHKPGALTEDETYAMRQHPTIAHDLLVTNEWMAHVLEIPYCHHENWDGTGYPRGLKGEEIPLAARIFAVVDNYDALTSDRPYRRAWTHEHALDYIRSQSGAMFDPAIVAKFLELMQ
jgi:HD-GYP domain-containing protein (c-di-GMP phosphodiesterase class II)